MLESAVELLSGLLLICLIFLIGGSVVGSIVAALRAVSRENAIYQSVNRRHSRSPNKLLGYRAIPTPPHK